MTAVDLFAGPGGWDVAAGDLWVDTIGLDISVDACATAEAAGHRREVADVTKTVPLAYADCTGLIASPPCQGFSIAGKGRGRQDADQLLSGIRACRTGEDVDHILRVLHTYMADDRSVLTLEPLRWALYIRPRWIALEQVPGVLPIWQATATVLERFGYSVATGVVHAEQHGVPQTRNRAVLLARSDGPVQLPAPTHSRYRPRRPEVVDPDVPAWTSAAQALGWDPADVVGFPRRADRVQVTRVNGMDYRARDLRPATLPAQAVTEKARSWWRWPADGADRVRVTQAEAAQLQTFRPDYPFAGNRTSRFHQLADAVPPLLGRALLQEVLQ